MERERESQHGQGGRRRGRPYKGLSPFPRRVRSPIYKCKGIPLEGDKKIARAIWHEEGEGSQHEPRGERERERRGGSIECLSLSND